MGHCETLRSLGRIEPACTEFKFAIRGHDSGISNMERGKIIAVILNEVKDLLGCSELLLSSFLLRQKRSKKGDARQRLRRARGLNAAVVE
jgi:hypothetical protein